MSYEINPDLITMEAGADLSAKQYHFVILASDGQIDGVGTAGLRADGVLQNDPSAAGRSATVAIGGVTKIVAGGVVTRGQLVASKNDGRAQTAATGNIVLGRALETSAADGDIIAMIFDPGHIVA